MLDTVIDIDPSIVTSAFLGTTCIFVCFSASAYFAERRSYLYLGGFLGSALSMLILVNFINVFARSAMLFNAQLYIGLMVFCGFIIFDTQLIIEKAANGSKDYIWDSLELFLDFINVFVRLLVILAKNSGGKKKNNR
jgi:FtsH-binding integral membrane protein